MTPVSHGSITTDPAALGKKRRANRRIRRAYRIEQFCAGNEHDAGRQRGEHPTDFPGVDFQIALAAFDRAHGDREYHAPRLEAGFDDEQSADTLTHGHG